VTPALAQSLAIVAARIAAKTWGGRWVFEPPPETREPGSFPGSKGSRDEQDVQRT
jgi:hypothetical protein